MTGRSERTAGAVGRLVVELNAAPPYELLGVVERQLADALGAFSVRLWLVDYEEAVLSLLVLDGPGADAGVPVEGTPHGRAYRAQELIVVGGDDEIRAHVPVTMRAERLGLLEVGLPRMPDDADRTMLTAVGMSIGHVIVAARRYTDVFEVTRRRRELELPAELQWELLPVLAHTGPHFGVAGSLEPAYDIGGDNFDYAVDAAGLTVSISDAMGHGMRAAMLSTLVVGAQRNARRRGQSLRQQVRAVNTAVLDMFGGESFATGLYLHVDRDSGETTAVNAGHSLAYLLRDGRVGPLDIEPDVPMGLFADAEFVSHTLRLEPGDRLLLYSDGLTEAADADGEQFGARRLERHLADTADRPAPEVVRLLTKAVSGFTDSYLADDATAVCIDYCR